MWNPTTLLSFSIYYFYFGSVLYSIEQITQEPLISLRLIVHSSIQKVRNANFVKFKKYR